MSVFVTTDLRSLLGFGSRSEPDVWHGGRFAKTPECGNAIHSMLGAADVRVAEAAFLRPFG